MAQTFSQAIPALTISGVPKTAAAAVPAGVTTFNVTVDVAQLDPATPQASRAQLYMRLEASYDGGLTWGLVCDKFQAGGSVPGDGGTSVTTAYMQGGVGGDPASATRRVRGKVQTFLADLVTPGPAFASAGGAIVAS